MVEKVFLQETYSLVCFFFHQSIFYFSFLHPYSAFFPHPSSFFALFPSEFYHEKAQGNLRVNSAIIDIFTS